VIHEDFVIQIKAGNSGDEYYPSSAGTIHTVLYPEKVSTSPSQSLVQIYEEVKVEQQ